MKILLVEDNERVAGFLMKGLGEAGHTVDHAGNGRDGLFLASSGSYDTIILDRILPGGDRGARDCRSLAQDREQNADPDPERTWRG